MLFGRKKKEETISYDPASMKPAIRASICTGEKVGGLLDRKTGKFTELRFLRDEKDVEAFARACGVEKVETIY